MTGGSKTYIPKKFYRTGGSKYIPKNFYTKTTYITLLSEKFGGSGAPPRPFYPSPLGEVYVVKSAKSARLGARAQRGALIAPGGSLGAKMGFFEKSGLRRKKGAQKRPEAQEGRTKTA
ncbi:hypothetical protein HanPSC8_Chr03g0130991 [Helianthus annuus]|nr:hypothetical protein HanPSC8_Chr03g0130991 [Helianthus annuus]